MSTRNLQSQTEPEPTFDRTATQTRPTVPPTATERAPRTFSHQSTGRLQNLIDEWNAGFADSSARSD